MRSGSRPCLRWVNDRLLQVATHVRITLNTRHDFPDSPMYGARQRMQDPDFILSSFDPDAERVNRRPIRSNSDLASCRRIDRAVFISCVDELKKHGLLGHALSKN